MRANAASAPPESRAFSAVSRDRRLVARAMRRHRAMPHAQRSQSSMNVASTVVVPGPTVTTHVGPLDGEQPSHETNDHPWPSVAWSCTVVGIGTENEHV